MRISAPNREARSCGATTGRFGFTTGTRAGVVTGPWAVSRIPMRARPSRSRTSNTRGHRAAANKPFPGFAHLGATAISRRRVADPDAASDVRPHLRRGLSDGGAVVAFRDPDL